jgi:hypothetical protein
VTGYYVSVFGPITYLVVAAVVAVIVRRPIAQAMDLDYDRSDTDEFVIAAMFVVIAALLWPMILLAWWARPRRTEGKSL